MHSWRRCRWPSGSWRRTCQLHDAAATSMKLNLETPGKQVRNSKGRLWNTSRGSRRYVYSGDAYRSRNANTNVRQITGCRITFCPWNIVVLVVLPAILAKYFLNRRWQGNQAGLQVPKTTVHKHYSNLCETNLKYVIILFVSKTTDCLEQL